LEYIPGTTASSSYTADGKQLKAGNTGMRLMLKLAAAFHLTIVHNRITKQIIMKTPWSVAPFNVEKPEIHMK